MSTVYCQNVRNDYFTAPVPKKGRCNFEKKRFGKVTSPDLIGSGRHLKEDLPVLEETK